MIYRRFGRTELRMPVLSCGGMRFQQTWQDDGETAIEAAGQANLAAIVKRAIDLGVNHFETARGYGSSERQLGRILPDLPRSTIIVQTKVPPVADREEFRRTFERSLSLLKLDYIDLVALHGVNNRQLLEQALRPDGPLAVLEQARRDGRIGHLGFSTHADTEVIVEAIESDAFDYVNLHWYYVEQRHLPALAAAGRHDMGVFIISPSDKGGKLYHPPARLVELCAPFSPVEFNDLFCLANPLIHTLSVGVAQPSDFDAHLGILPSVDNAAAAIAPVLARLDQAMRQAVGDAWADHWDAGIPSWEAIPGHANLYQTLRLYGLWKAFDLIDYAHMRYNLLGNGGHWFPGAKVDALDWQQLPGLLRQSPFAETIPAILRECHEAFSGADAKRLGRD